MIICFPALLPGQPVNLGTPPIRNFPRKVYAAGTQNWDAAQDAQHILYFANNDGLLRFDGTAWRVFPVANNTIVRSVAVAPDGRIYAGAQSELGYFAPGENGVLGYTSLVGLLPPGDRNFEDVWNIVPTAEGVFFRTSRKLFRYAGESMTAFSPNGELHAMFPMAGGLIVQEGYNELKIFRDGRFESYAGIGDLQSPVTGAVDWTPDTMLLTTLKHGIYYLSGRHTGHWSTSVDPLLAEKRIYTATLLSDSTLALGTSLDGLFTLDRRRRPYRHLSKGNGLQNTNILHVFRDRAGSLWLGLNSGIDYVDMNSMFTAVYPDGELRGTGYAAAVHDGMLYLGGSNGLYATPWSVYFDPRESSPFRPVARAEGQAWGLVERDNLLWVGHHEGAFQADGFTATPVSPDPGYWTFVQVSPDYILAGSYAGLSLFRKTGGQWRFDGPVEGLRESCRIMVSEADGTVWVSHPYRGVYRIQWREANRFKPDIHFYNQSAGLPSNLNNYVFAVAGRAVFGTEKGVYIFDKQQERFAPDPDFEYLLGSARRVKHLHEDARGNIWYAAGDEVGRLRIADSGLRKAVNNEVFPQLAGRLVGGFEFIYPIDADNILFGTEEGFIHFTDNRKPPADTHLQITITEVRSLGKLDSLLFGGYPFRGESPCPVLPAGMNNLGFTYSAAEYGLPGLVEYRTRLDGMEDDWSAWTAEPRRVISNISAGRHTFYVQARIREGAISAVASFSFRIRPPWYASIPARFCYGLMIMGAFAGIITRQRNRFESEKAKMAESHQLIEAERIREVEASKAALTEIQTEKLEAEINFKNQELAMTTMHLVQKAELLLTVQEGLHQLREKAVAPDVKKEIQHLLSLLNFDVKLDEDWAHFAQYFDQVHVDFLKNLREQFPQLSPNDFKLCAYLRMNLSTKEIAPLMNISVRGVEGSRYRLRRKLNLPNDANLTDFIMNLPPSATQAAGDS